MKVCGIIVEFNPLHHGHVTHINETKAITKCDYVLGVMSGNFVQRGEPALCNKWHRTKMALLNGVDAVVEIPMQYVITGADYFARASVQLLNATGVVDSLCFGSESGNLEEITRCGEILAKEPEMYKNILREKLSQGLSFAVAKGAALAGCMGQDEREGLFTKPNNGLAMEYCKANSLMGNRLEIFTTHRVSGGVSATATRRGLRVGDTMEQNMPENVKDILQGAALARLDDFSSIFRYLLFSNPGKWQGLEEGLGNRFLNMCGEYEKLSELIMGVKTKRFAHTRLQRTCLQFMLGVGKEDMRAYEAGGGMQYVRLLGFRKDAAKLVSRMVDKATLPVITHGRAIDEIIWAGGLPGKMLQEELRAGDIYRLATGEKGGVDSERGMGVMVV